MVNCGVAQRSARTTQWMMKKRSTMLAPEMKTMTLFARCATVVAIRIDYYFAMANRESAQSLCMSIVLA